MAATNGSTNGSTNGPTTGSTIGIRREDKNEWERRVPLVPADLSDLQRDNGLRFLVQPSTIRVFSDDEYRGAGAEVTEDLDPAQIVLAVKEIPSELLRNERVYVYFSHVIKGQSYNMPMLARLLELGATLIDYEKIADDDGRRLIFFSLHAGYAGMIESLWCLGQRLQHLGQTTPLLQVKHAYEYSDLEHAKAELRRIGDEIAGDGLGTRTTPLVLGVAGYGNVARGCQEILACLPVVEATPQQLLDAELPDGPLVSVTFKEEDMVAPRESGASFALQDYYEHPEKYVGRFERFLPHIDLLMNTIYWEERYPRLVTKAWAASQYGPGHQPRLQVIGDISCDIDGSIELTAKSTYPDDPCYVYEAGTGEIRSGVVGEGPVIMAVDNLPCELPRESSEHFSTVLRAMVPALAATNWQADFAELELPSHLARAVIVHRGHLTPDYTYLSEFVHT